RTVSYRIRTNGTAFNETPAQIGPWFNRPTWEATLLFPSRWVQESTITGPAVVEPIYGSIRAGSSRPIGIHRCRLQACETRLHAGLGCKLFSVGRLSLHEGEKAAGVPGHGGTILLPG